MKALSTSIPLDEVSYLFNIYEAREQYTNAFTLQARTYISQGKMTTSPPPDPSISPMKRKRHGGESEGIDKRTRVTDAPPPPEVQEHKLAVVNKILRETFRYTHLRTYQQEAILSVLDGKNTLVVLPTAAGKSLCFQVCSFPSYLSISFFQRKDR
jgi:ATP-dependent helicase YprA (DUF1998 family)